VEDVDAPRPVRLDQLSARRRGLAQRGQHAARVPADPSTVRGRAGVEGHPHVAQRTSKSRRVVAGSPRGSVAAVSHDELLESVWASVPAGAEPEHFAERRDWLLARVGPGERVLDLGCGEGQFTAALAAAGAHPLGVDVVAEPLRRARERHPELHFRHEPLDGPLVFGDGTFDVVWAGEVIEHVVDVAGWLSEVRRVLPSGGRLLLTTPDHPPELLARLAADPAAFAEHFDPRSDHVRFFNARSLGEVVEDLGFEAVDLAADGRTLWLQAVRARW